MPLTTQRSRPACVIGCIRNIVSWEVARFVRGAADLLGPRFERVAQRHSPKNAKLPPIASVESSNTTGLLPDCCSHTLRHLTILSVECLRQGQCIGRRTQTRHQLIRAMSPAGHASLQQRTLHNGAPLRSVPPQRRPSLPCQAGAHHQRQDALTATEPSTSGNDAVSHEARSRSSRRALLLGFACIPATSVSALAGPPPVSANEFLEGNGKKALCST
jgi:hypothetical protein